MLRLPPTDLPLQRAPGTIVGVGASWAWALWSVETEGKGSLHSPSTAPGKAGSPMPQCSMLQCPVLQRVCKLQAPLPTLLPSTGSVSLSPRLPLSTRSAFCSRLQVPPPHRAQGTRARYVSAGVGSQPSAVHGLTHRGKFLTWDKSSGIPGLSSACAPSRRERTEIWKLPRGEDCRVSLAHLPMSLGTELRRRVLAVQ